MNKLAKCLLMLMMVTASLQQCADKGAFDAVNSLNLDVKLAAIELDTKTKFTSTQLCGDTFTKHGSCCDLTNVKTVIDAIVKRIKLNLGNLGNAVAGAEPIIKNLGSLTTIFGTKDPTSSTKDETFLASIGGDQEYNKIKSILDHISSGSSDFKTKLASYEGEKQKCISSLISLKANSVCMICSGSGSKFFDAATKKFKIKKEFCQTLVNDCMSTFETHTKVTHLLEAVRVIRNALSNTNVVKLDPNFSQSKLSTFEGCTANLATCISDQSKLASMCGEFGVAKDIRVIKNNENKLTDTATIKTDAQTGFTTSITAQGAKLDAVKATKMAAQVAFATEAPAKIAAVAGLSTSIGAKVAALGTAVTALQTAAGPAPVAAARVARATAVTEVTVARDSLYTGMKSAVTAFLTAAKDDLAKSTGPEFDTKRTKYEAAVLLNAKIDEAITRNTDLKAKLETQKAAETTLNGGAADQAAEGKFMGAVEGNNKLDISIKTGFDGIIQDANALFAAKAQAIAAEATKIDTLKTSGTSLGTAATSFSEYEAKAIQKRQVDIDTAIATAKVDAANGFKTALTTAAPKPKVDLDTTVTDVTEYQVKLNQWVNTLQSISDKGTVSPINISGALTDLDTLLVTLESEKTTKIPALQTAVSGRTTATDQNVVNVETAITEANTGIAAQDAIINTATTGLAADRTNMETERASMQNLLAALNAAKQEMDSCAVTVNTPKLQLIDLTTASQIKQGQFKSKYDFAVEQKPALERIKATMACSTTGNPPAACATLTTQIAALDAEITTNENAISAEMNSLTTAITPIKAAIATAETNCAAKKTALTNAQNAVASKDAALKTLQNSIDTKNAAKQGASVLKAGLQAKLAESQANKNAYIALVKEAKTALNNQATAVTAFRTEFEAKLTALVNAKNAANPASTSPNTPLTFPTALKDAVLALRTSLIAKKTELTTATTAGAATSSSCGTAITTKSTEVTATVNTLTTAKDTLTASQTQLTNSLSTLTTTITGTGAPPPPPPRRLLEAEETDFTLDNEAGADLTTEFSTGVKIDTDITNSNGSPADAGTTTSTQAKSGNTLTVVLLVFLAIAALMF